MTGDGISRRRLLQAGALAGSLGVASGATTQALLGDVESMRGTTASAGELDLLVGAATGVEPGHWSPTVEGLADGVDVELLAECGTTGLAVTVCGNPGAVSLSMAADAGGIGVDVRDEPFVSLHVGDCANGRVVAAGRLSTVLADLADGVWLHPETAYLGKIEADRIADGERITFDHDGDPVAVTVEPIDEGGETVGVDLTVDGARLSQVNVKGGGHPFPKPCEVPPWAVGPQGCADDGPPGGGPDQPSPNPGPPDRGGPPGGGSSGRRIGVKPYFFDCASSATALRTRDDGATAVSHLELYVCERRCLDCETRPPLPAYLTWAGATAEHTLPLAVEAVQCRHTAGGERA